jgi:hypothetical protein
MTPKEKANELIEKHTYKCVECDFTINACMSALVTVNEIIEGGFADGYDHNFWINVKKYIEEYSKQNEL